MEEHIGNLRDWARQCRSVARGTTHRPTAAMLEQMAIEYETQATQLEIQQKALAVDA